LPSTLALTSEAGLAGFKGVVECAQPNEHIYKFDSQLRAAPGAPMLLVTPPEPATPNPRALDEVARGLEYLTFIDALPEAQNHGTPLGEARFELTGGLTIQIRCSRLDQFLFIRLTAEGPEAQSLNARWQGWAYQVGIWKETAFLPTLEELTQSP
jgi:hypothetical protein